MLTKPHEVTFGSTRIETCHESYYQDQAVLTAVWSGMGYRAWPGWETRYTQTEQLRAMKPFGTRLLIRVFILLWERYLYYLSDPFIHPEIQAALRFLLVVLKIRVTRARHHMAFIEAEFNPNNKRVEEMIRA